MLEHLINGEQHHLHRATADITHGRQIVFGCRGRIVITLFRAHIDVVVIMFRFRDRSIRYLFGPVCSDTIIIFIF